jgi:hypothetical protein
VVWCISRCGDEVDSSAAMCVFDKTLLCSLLCFRRERPSDVQTLSVCATMLLFLIFMCHDTLVALACAGALGSGLYFSDSPDVSQAYAPCKQETITT